jgi:hypothetical protein
MTPLLSLADPLLSLADAELAQMIATTVFTRPRATAAIVVAPPSV